MLKIVVQLHIFVETQICVKFSHDSLMNNAHFLFILCISPKIKKSKKGVGSKIIKSCISQS